MKLPSISIVIPTLNAEKYLRECLDSIDKQDYPKEKIELIIADGGSKDGTLKISKMYKADIYANPLKTSESGKALGIRKAKNTLILLIDSDNILDDRNWLKKMVVPFGDKEIVGTEPIRFTVRSTDSIMNRYWALMGMNDPVCLFLGTYDKWNYITNTWTNTELDTKRKQTYIKIGSKTDSFITMGANGFLVRKDTILPYTKSDYLFDVDVTYDIAVNNHSFFAKVDCGIIHLYADSMKIFIKKQKRRIKDYLQFRHLRNQSGTSSGRLNYFGLLKFCFYTVLVIPLIFQMVIGYSRKRDIAWFLHPLVCYITFIIYTRIFLQRILFSHQSEMKRDNW